MMKFEDTWIYGIDAAMRGMRLPMKSKSDSFGEQIGPADLDLARRLWLASEVDNLAHSKFLRQIFVGVNISAPLFIWSEADTYKIGTTANSESTMHTLLKEIKTLSIDNFSCDDSEAAGHIIGEVIPRLNSIVMSDRPEIKKLRALKEILPSSFIQKRYWTSNYEVIRNMYKQRKNHRLSEWSVDFAAWASSLPYAEDFITKSFVKDLSE